MRLILISNPVAIEKEEEVINVLFEKGLDHLHLRKPDFSRPELEGFLKKINPLFYRKTSIHSHYRLIEKYNLGGIHLTEAMRKTEETREIVKVARKRGLKVSASLHNFSEINECVHFDYVFLSPVFESISKPGYFSSLDLREVKKWKEQGASKPPIIALGGVTKDSVGSVIETGFDGAALLGAVWKNMEATRSSQKGIDAFLEIQSKVAELLKA